MPSRGASVTGVIDTACAVLTFDVPPKHSSLAQAGLFSCASCLAVYGGFADSRFVLAIALHLSAVVYDRGCIQKTRASVDPCHCNTDEIWLRFANYNL